MDNNLLTIRKVKLEDARGWHQLKNKVWRDAYSHIFPETVFLEREAKIEENIKKFANLIKNNNETIAYVAEYDKEIVGIMYGRINSSYDHFKSEYADLGALYIDPKFQGYGIGSKFKNIFEEWAIKKGATKYVIGVLKDNIKARKVYETWGGELTNYEADFVKQDMRYPEVFYTFSLPKDLDNSR